MKTKIYYVALALGFVLMQASCGESGPAIEDEQKGITKKLSSKVWSPMFVSRDGVDETASYSAMTLTVGSGTYTTTNGGLSWPASGTWQFVNGSKTQILRDGATVINFELAPNAATLTLDFELDENEYEGGRVGSLEGSYHFEFD